MEMLWPGFLFLLGLIPLIVATYIWVLRRRRYAVRYSSLALVHAALPGRSGLRRHVPLALFLLGLASLVIALTRPVVITTLPANQATILLAIDVSRSMRSMDIPPSRLQAAENAALSFIQHQKSNTQIGIVAFSGYAELVQPPTNDQAALRAAIESLTLGRRTAIGAGILQSLDAIAEVDKNVTPSITDGSGGIEPAPPPKGAYAPDIVVLLTDGVSNAGPLPLDSAKQAVDRGVRVYTIGFGTANGAAQFDNGFGGGFGGGFRTGIDETTLKQIASMTGGAYYSAQSAGELESIFRALPTYLIAKHEVVEISVLFTALGGLLAALAITLALLWHPLP